MASILKNISRQLAALSVCSVATTLPALAAPDVVASIAPVHSIAAAIMKGVGSPHLLVPPSASPHSTDLRPSGARALQDADLVFWVGPRLEAFLIKPIESLTEGAKNVPLVEAEGIELLPLRSGGNWEKHSHADGDHDHEGHDHEKEGDDHDHEGKEHAEHDHEHEGHDHEDHDHDAEGKFMDSHVWLSPNNGLAMAAAMTKALSEIDPDNAKTYATNHEAFKADVKAAVEEADGLLANYKTAPFIVFHDAYQYFETAFDLSAIGSITLNPSIKPGAARIKEIKEKINQLGVACLLSEPQFSDKITDILIEGTNAKKGQLDPIGSAFEEGPTLYPDLIRYNARQLADCLKGA